MAGERRIAATDTGHATIDVRRYTSRVPISLIKVTLLVTVASVLIDWSDEQINKINDNNTGSKSPLMRPQKVGQEDCRSQVASERKVS